MLRPLRTWWPRHRGRKFGSRSAPARDAPISRRGTLLGGARTASLSGARQALRVVSDLRDPGGPEQSGEQGATDRGEQQRDPEGDMAGRAEIADPDALRVLEDEDQQQDQ